MILTVLAMATLFVCCRSVFVGMAAISVRVHINLFRLTEGHGGDLGLVGEVFR